MPLHKTMKDCNQCGHRVDAAIMVCPRCKTVFDTLAEQSDSSTGQTAGSGNSTMNQAQVDAISQEKLEFARRWKERTAKKHDDKKQS